MCDCFFWAKMTLKYEVLMQKTYNFNKNLPKSLCFDNGIRHFDATKPQYRPLTPLIIGVGVRRFDRMCALLKRIPPCKKSAFLKKVHIQGFDIKPTISAMQKLPLIQYA